MQKGKICFFTTILIFLLISCNAKQPLIYTYTISPTICEACFSMTVTDFCNSQTPSANPPILFDSATIDESGNLVLSVSEKQRIEWEKWIEPYTNYMGGIDLSEDYTKIAVEFYKDELTSIIIAVPYCIHMQILNGKQSEDIKVECLVIGENETDIISHTVFPNEKNIFDLSVFENHIE